MALTNHYDGPAQDPREAAARGETAAGPAAVQQQLALKLLQDVRRYWWVVVLAMAVNLGSAVYFAARQVPVFQARTTLMIVPDKTLKEPREIADSLNTLDRRTIIATLAMLPSSRTLTAEAGRQLQLGDKQFARFSVKTSVVPDSNVLELTVAGPDPRIAAMLANKIADMSVAGTSGLYGIFEMQILDRAEQPAAPLGTAVPRMLFAAALLGLLIGVAVAFLLGNLRRGWRFGGAHSGRMFAADSDNDDHQSDQPQGIGSSAILQLKPYGKPRRPVASSDVD
jgi:uncharacterized protein involved in exopolysaccharide biosynthesis